MRAAALLIAASTARSRGAIGSLDFGDGADEPDLAEPRAVRAVAVRGARRAPDRSPRRRTRSSGSLELPRHRCAARSRRGASSSSSRTSSRMPCRDRLARGDRPPLGHRPRRDPGSGLGGELPGRRRRRRHVRRCGERRRAARSHAPWRGAAAPQRARGAPRRADPPLHRSRARAGGADERRPGRDPRGVPRLGRRAPDRPEGGRSEAAGAASWRRSPSSSLLVAPRRPGGRCALVPRLGDAAHAPLRRPGRGRGAGGSADRRCSRGCGSRPTSRRT